MQETCLCINKALNLFLSLCLCAMFGLHYLLTDQYKFGWSLQHTMHEVCLFPLHGPFFSGVLSIKLVSWSNAALHTSCNQNVEKLAWSNEPKRISCNQDIELLLYSILQLYSILKNFWKNLVIKCMRLASPLLNAPVCLSTCVISSSRNSGTLKTWSKALLMPSCSMTSALLVVPMTISLCPFGGGFFSIPKTTSVRVFENLGPIGLNSMILSISSTITSELGDCRTQRASTLYSEFWEGCENLGPIG